MSRTHSPGQVRAALGALTHIREPGFLAGGYGKRGAHAAAFEAAGRAYFGTWGGRDLAPLWARWRERSAGELDRPAGGACKAASVPEECGWDGDVPTVVSMCSGAGGLDCGFASLGYDVRLAVDSSEAAVAAYRANFPGTRVLRGDVSRRSALELASEAGLRPGSVGVLAAGPPCQPFSDAGRRRAAEDPRSDPVLSFFRAARTLRPRFLVLENVMGLATVRERPGAPKGSMWARVVGLFSDAGYHVAGGGDAGADFRPGSRLVYRAEDYGAPQRRRRIVAVGVRDRADTWALERPRETHGSPWGEPHVTFWDAVADLQGGGGVHECLGLPKRVGRLLEQVPPGGNWRQLRREQQVEALGGALTSGGGRTGFCRRLSWDEPVPTLLASPSQRSTILGHPEACRPLSVREYSRVQGLPDAWTWAGASTRQKYALIGNAVPGSVSLALARHLSQAWRCGE